MMNYKINLLLSILFISLTVNAYQTEEEVARDEFLSLITAVKNESKIVAENTESIALLFTIKRSSNYNSDAWESAIDNMLTFLESISNMHNSDELPEALYILIQNLHKQCNNSDGISGSLDFSFTPVERQNEELEENNEG